MAEPLCRVEDSIFLQTATVKFIKFTTYGCMVLLIGFMFHLNLCV